jgi:RimJ/RimL family protein N-acetyltransferase
MSNEHLRILDLNRLPLVVEPVTLAGQGIRLEPLSIAHYAHLCEVGLDDELWRWIPQAVHTPEEMRAYIETALAWQAAGTALPFATIERATGRAIGSTRFANIDPANRHVEIGWTWLGRKWQRTAANTEAKYLMLRHAFETWRCLRVEFKTDSLNERSRAALLRIGAKEEGIFRNHVISWTGRVRHSVYYSIIDSEWPAVKAQLQDKLGMPPLHFTNSPCSPFDQGS